MARGLSTRPIHLKYGGKPGNNRIHAASVSSGLRTSTIHQVTHEVIEDTKASLHVLSDIQHPEFREAVYGHTMNKCGVATSSIWTDVALSVGEYLYKKPQQLGPRSGSAPRTWFLGRIEALQQLADENKANRISKRMACTLFKKVVDYAEQYRGIDSMILHEYEAVADVTLVNHRHGTWHTPPHRIDSVCHLAGLIMNGSDASNTDDYFYVTPGSDSLRSLKPLEPGGKYKSCVRMFPLPVVWKVDGTRCVSASWWLTRMIVLGSGR